MNWRQACDARYVCHLVCVLCAVSQTFQICVPNVVVFLDISCPRKRPKNLGKTTEKTLSQPRTRKKKKKKQKEKKQTPFYLPRNAKHPQKNLLFALTPFLALRLSACLPPSEPQPPRTFPFAYRIASARPRSPPPTAPQNTVHESQQPYGSPRRRPQTPLRPTSFYQHSFSFSHKQPSHTHPCLILPNNPRPSHTSPPPSRLHTHLFLKSSAKPAFPSPHSHLPSSDPSPHPRPPSPPSHAIQMARHPRAEGGLAQGLRRGALSRARQESPSR